MKPNASITREEWLIIMSQIRAAAEPSVRPIYIRRDEAEFIDDACLKDGAPQWHELQDQVREKFGMTPLKRSERNEDAKPAMNVRELIAILRQLDMDMPVAVCAMGNIYMSGAHRESHGPLQVGILNTYAGQHVVIGGMIAYADNPPNWYLERMSQR